jgi:hypothetical protein
LYEDFEIQFKDELLMNTNGGIGDRKTRFIGNSVLNYTTERPFPHDTPVYFKNKK